MMSQGCECSRGLPIRDALDGILREFLWSPKDRISTVRYSVSSSR